MGTVEKIGLAPALTVRELQQKAEPDITVKEGRSQEKPGAGES